jgi:hypothetical protein
MAHHKYRGPVENIEQAMQAGDILRVTCQTCFLSKSIWAWRIFNWRKKDAAIILLNKPRAVSSVGAAASTRQLF